MDITYTSGNAVRISGLRYKKLDEILRSGLLKPSAKGGQGRGCPRRFTERDLLALRLVRELLKAGIRLKKLVGVLRFVQRGRGLPQLHELADMAIWSDGHQVVLFDKNNKNAIGASSERSVNFVIHLGPAAEHVRLGIERINATATGAQRPENKKAH